MCWPCNRTLVFPSCHSFFVTSYFVSRSAHFLLSSAVWFLSLRIIVYLHRKWAQLKHIPPHSFYCKGTMSWSNVNRFRKTSLALFIMVLTLTLTNFPKKKKKKTGIWNRFCASNFILMDCQWFCDSFLATCLTCWGSLGRFSVQEILLYGSSLSPAFQSNVADSEPHLHQIYLHSGRR